MTNSNSQISLQLAGSREGGAARTSIPSTIATRAHFSQNSVGIDLPFRSQRLTICRQSGQGGEAETQHRDLRAELLAAEAAHFAKSKGTNNESSIATSSASKRALEAPSGQEDVDDEDPETKRRKILEESREIDADSGGSDSDSSEEDSEEDDEDETAELMRELEKIKRERAEKKAQEVCSTLLWRVVLKAYEA